MSIAVAGLGALVLSIVLAAIFGGHPQWLDAATTAGFLGGTLAYGGGLLWWFWREMRRQ